MSSKAAALPSAGGLTPKVARLIYDKKVCLRIGAMKQDAGAINSAYAMATDVAGWFGEKDGSARMAKQLAQVQFEVGILETEKTASLKDTWEEMLDETLKLICGFENATDQKILLITGGSPGAADYKGAFPKVMNLQKTAPIIAETTFAVVKNAAGLKAWIYSKLAELAPD